MSHRHVIGSSYTGRARGGITLRGEIDSDAADQFAEHLDAFPALETIGEAVRVPQGL